jgi:hypothetical protein
LLSVASPFGFTDKATAATVGPLIVGNNAAAGAGPIQTYDFSTGALVNSFVPSGATSSSNGRALAVAGNQVYYSELSSDVGASDAIHIAPFNGGAGGADVGTLPNPAPSVGIQDLVYANGALYALTGYAFGPLQVWKLNPANGAVLAGPIGINSDPSADGFAVLPDGNFLINAVDDSCLYSEYSFATGAPTGSQITVPGASQGCTGVDTDGTALYFQTDFSAFTKTDLTGNLISRTSVAPNSVEDISLVAATGTACGSAKFFGVRGSGEHSNFGSTMLDLDIKLQTAVPTIQTQPIDYPAVDVDLNPFHTTYPANYVNSVNKGVQTLDAAITDYLQQCPGKRVVLGGYSQGAEVVRNAFLNLKDTQKRSVAAVALFGDPLFNPKDTQIVRGTFLNFTGIDISLLGDRATKIPGAWNQRFVDYCTFGDPVCNYNVASAIACLTDACPHYHYASLGWVSDSIPGIVAALQRK